MHVYCVYLLTKFEPNHIMLTLPTSEEYRGIGVNWVLTKLIIQPHNYTSQEPKKTPPTVNHVTTRRTSKGPIYPGQLHCVGIQTNNPPKPTTAHHATTHDYPESRTAPQPTKQLHCKLTNPTNPTPINNIPDGTPPHMHSTPSLLNTPPPPSPLRPYTALGPQVHMHIQSCVREFELQTLFE